MQNLCKHYRIIVQSCARRPPVTLIDEGEDFQETLVIVIGAVGRGSADFLDGAAADAPRRPCAAAAGVSSRPL